MNGIEVRSYSILDCVSFRKTNERFGALSNMAPGFPLRVNGIIIRTSEALYQSCRFPHLPEIQQQIIKESSPMTVKMITKPYRNQSRSDWDSVRVRIMRWCLRLKLAQHWQKFSAVLLATSDKPIVEDSWKDDFWGAKPQANGMLIGRNVLGRLLMELREVTRAHGQNAFLTVEPPDIPEFLFLGGPIGTIGVLEESANESADLFSESSKRLNYDQIDQTSLFNILTDGDLHAPVGTTDDVSRELFGTYPATKDSRLMWLGQVPTTWKLKPAKRLFSKQARAIRVDDRVVTCFRDGTVTLREKRRLTGFTESIKEIGYQGIREGDLVIHAMDAFAGAVGVSDSDGKGSPVYSVCKAKEGVSSSFYAYVVREMARSQWIQALAKGIRERSTDFRYKDFGAQLVPLPPHHDQLLIVQYLNYSNRRIQKYIRAKKKLIKLLEEQKQAVINQAVTKGLNPDVKMKPSGIEWLGEIPEHWESKRARYIFHEVNERSQLGDEQHLSMSQKLGLVPSEQVDNRTLVSVSYSGGKLCYKGDLVLNRLKAHLGVFSTSLYDGVISPDYTVLRPFEPGSSRFFEHVLRSHSCRRELRIRTKGVVEGFWRLYTNDFYDIHLPCPSIKEREQITCFIDTLMTSTEQLRALYQGAISIVGEYRTRLISDAVTGKIDVREIAAQLPDEEDDFDVPELDDVLDEAIDEMENEVEEDE